MIPLAGHAATSIAFVAATMGCLLALRAAHRREKASSAVLLAGIALVGLGLAAVLMEAALVGHDFSVDYVSRIGSRGTPLLYTVASLWGALEGSIVLWALLLAAVTVLLVVRTDAATRPLLPIALAVLLGVLAVFAFVVAGPGNPWGRVSPLPADGPGPNPLLRNHPLMAIHPPILYTGFVTLAVPFALTIAALVRGRLDEAWLRAVRRWTLGAWAFLTAGLVLGAWWSYAVLGWGGYWGWDPVENVALLPWLTATALLHLARTERAHVRRPGALVMMAIASFALTVLATLVTRSGLLDSVHAFSTSGLGPLLLALLAVSLTVAVVAALRGLPPTTPAPRSVRDTALVAGSALLVAVAAIVVLGTLAPVATELLGLGRSTIGAPYFERFVAPLAALVVGLLGVGPVLARTLPATRRAALVAPALVATALAVALVMTGAGAAAVAGTCVAAFALGASVVALLGPMRSPRHAPPTGRRSRGRRIGGILAHAGIAVVALVVVLSRTGERVETVSVDPGATVSVLGRSLRYAGPVTATSDDRVTTAAGLELSGDGAPVPLAPELALIGQSSQAVTTPAILSSPVTDLYVTLLGIDEAGRATLRVGVHPFVFWLWPGGLLAAVGGLLLVAPRRPEPALAHRLSVDPIGEVA